MGERGGLGAVGGLGLAQDRAYVICDRVFADRELGADLTVAEAAGDQGEDLRLAGERSAGSSDGATPPPSDWILADRPAIPIVRARAAAWSR